MTTLIKSFTGHDVVSGVANYVLYPSKFYYLLEVKPVKMLYHIGKRYKSSKGVQEREKSLPF